jgi:hypothetical protein
MISGSHHKSSLVVLFGALLPVALAQQSAPVRNSDYHMLQDSAHKVYCTSAFAHGHRHGYEEGFHAGDEDYHLRHSPNPTGKSSKQNGYKHEFGDKKIYMRGFAIGFRAGYADSYSGQGFRSTEEISRLEMEIPTPIDPRVAKVMSNYVSREEALSFDTGAEQGYKDGYSSAEATTFAPGLGELASEKCEAEHENQPAFCGGYATGFLLGKDDIRSLRTLRSLEPGKIPSKD